MRIELARARRAMAGTTGNGFVWEWQRDDGGFSPFPPQDSAKIEMDYNTSVITCKISGYGRLDFKKMTLRRTGSRRECNIRRSMISLPLSPPINAYWTWNDRDDSFVPYSINATVDIELAYMQFTRAPSHTNAQSSIDLSKCGSQLPYTINFYAMFQTRHGYGTQRAVRREVIPGGQSLQDLLQPHTSVNSSSHLVSLAGGSGFSLATGPATSMMLRSGTSRGSGGTLSVAQTASVPSATKPTTRKGRGKKNSPTLSSTAMGRGGDAEVGDAGARMPEYVTLVKVLKPADDGPCPICMCELSEMSGYEEGGVAMLPGPSSTQMVDLCKLCKCGHMMHRPCLLMLLKSESAKNGLMCPTCKKVYGTRTGDMPDGTMSVRCTHKSLPGHEGYGTIEIIYNFSPGVHNGRHYRANGFPRVCYLPDSPKGQKVLKLLKIAWERRLTFTIGTSVTTGAMDTVVWNEIHHKTESTSNYSGHGYPDPNYLDNVLMELSLQGVEDPDSAAASSTSDDSL